MAVCSGCGRTSEGDFAFCPYCGAKLDSRPLAREQRKVVTVLFCDITGSTTLGESTDPEALRALLARYFERMKGIVEAHGGTVEKFIGDAVMAVFGAPIVHEDDALRAARAALEMRDALPDLAVAARIGVNSGEVVTGTEERLATGDAVNVAARLEQAAEPGEILMGETTRALLRDAVEVEAVDPLALKGKGSLVAAFRLLSVTEPVRRHDTPMVGREAEFQQLRAAVARAVRNRACELVTLVGAAGVGKSRLAHELVSSLGFRMLQGRCLPYGEGITYWPVVEVLKQLRAFPTDPAAAAALRSLLGETDAGTSPEEIAWAFRKLLEEQARDDPLVCLFDDIQWAEQTFLDLIEHLALLARDAAIVVLCLARPELVERRPNWPIALSLEPLADADVETLMPERLGDELRVKIRRASGGNPLFVTEMVAMADETGGTVAVPASLQALLAARLDQLESRERSVLESASVEGEIFHRGAVQALSDGQPVTPRLASLMRKGLIRPDKAQLPGEDAFRFRHILIRDAAYDSLPKAARAELHEQLAAWLERHAVDLVERDELLGYHLEQSVRYGVELGRSNPKLAQQAGERLAIAGRRALWRGDLRAAAPLLERALALTRPLALDVHLELDLADAREGPRERAAVAEAAAERAGHSGDELGEALALVVAAHARLNFEADPQVDELEQLAKAVLPRLEETGDHDGMARVWLALGAGVALFRLRFEEMAQACERALEHWRLAGSNRSGGSGLPPALVRGPRPADEALRTFDSVLPATSFLWDLFWRAQLVAMLGRQGEARAIALPAAERARELSGDSGGVGEAALAEIAALGGDYETAAQYLRTVCDRDRRLGARGTLSTSAPALGRYLCALGRFDEAEPLAQLGRELGDERDVATQMLWRQVQARVYAHRGEHPQAERLAREAVVLGEPTDALNAQADALADLGEVLAAAGRNEDAVQALGQALDRYERKRNLAMASQVRAKRDELRTATAA